MFYSQKFLKKEIVKCFSFLCLTVLVFFCFCVKAQNPSNKNGYGIALNTGYDSPVGNLGYTFKGASTFGISFLSYRDNFTTSLSIGYHVYKPKLDTFYYQIDAANYGTIHYDNFSVYSIYLGIAYNLAITDGLKFYGGINFGIYYTHMLFHSTDEFLDDSANLNDEDLYLAPKIGFNYLISNNIAIGVEGKYNGFLPTGDRSSNSRVGTLYNSFAGNFILTFNF